MDYLRKEEFVEEHARDYICNSITRSRHDFLKVQTFLSPFFYRLVALELLDIITLQPTAFFFLLLLCYASPSPAHTRRVT